MSTQVEITDPSDPIESLPLTELLRIQKQIEKLVELKTLHKPVDPAASLDNNINNAENASANNHSMEIEFTAPKKTALKRKPTTQNNDLATANKFHILDTIPTEDDSYEANFPLITKPKQQTHKTQQTTTKKTSQITPHIEKIPPIVIHEKTKWSSISGEITRNKLNYTKATTVHNGIKIEPSSVEDYRAMITLLREKMKVQFHFYELNSEKQLKVVLRGVIQELSDEEITNNLHQQGYPISKISRMLGKNKQPAPMVLIEIDREYKSIYNLTHCCGLTITAEPLKAKTGLIQCHRCQMFGHAQKNCNADYKCLKCGGDHSTHLCTKLRTTPAKCANCAGEHPANYHKCVANPNNKPIETPKPTKPWTKINVNEESNATQPQTQKQTTQKEKSLATILGEMLITLSATNATQEQKIQFLSQTQQIMQIFRNTRQN